MNLLVVLFISANSKATSGSNCPDDWIDCGYGVCVAYLYHCDGDNDCINLKDEENCDSGVPPKPCLNNQFRCERDGSCIPSTWRCDGGHDCSDNSDENNCTAPGEVTQIIFDSVTPTTVEFRFMGPENTGGLLVTNYTMRYKLKSDPEDKTVTVNWVKDSPYILRDLKPRKKYQFSVAARNRVGVGPWKSVDYLMPDEMVPEPPTIITEPETISHHPDHFEVRWGVPNDNGEIITQFEVRYFKVERGIKGWAQVDEAIEVIINNWDKTPSLELTGLHPDAYYKIEIRATNKLGSSLPKSVVIRTRAESRACRPDQFRCGDGQCIDNSLKCDRKYHCTDGTDEFSCEPRACQPDEFRCGNGQCIDNKLKCDQKYDCSDGTDELSCATTESCVNKTKHECPKNHCSQNAKCVVLGEKFECRCTQGYGGERCEIETGSWITNSIWIPSAIIAIVFLFMIMIAIYLKLKRSPKIDFKRENSKDNHYVNCEIQLTSTKGRLESL